MYLVGFCERLIIIVVVVVVVAYRGNVRVVDVKGNLRDGRTLSVNDLKPGNVYQYIVAAESAMGIGVFSAPVQRRMPPAVPAQIEQPKVRAGHFSVVLFLLWSLCWSWFVCVCVCVCRRFWRSRRPS